jgi:predicted PurR-regulated permease PerM
MLEQPRDRLDVTHTTLSVLFLALLAIGTYWVLRPFLTAMLWATIVSVTMWPLLLRLETSFGRKPRRGLAVTIVTAAILLVVFIPVTLALVTIVKSAYALTTDIQLDSIALPAPPGWLDRIPFAGERVAGEWKRFDALSTQDRARMLAPYLQTALQWFAVTAGSIGTMLLQFLLTTIITAIMLAKGEEAREMILGFSRRLAGQQGEDVAVLAGKAIRGVVMGVVGTALAQTAVGGLGLFIAGIPAAGLLTAVMLFFCLAQLGPAFILLPAVFWLYWSGHSGWGTVLLVISLVVLTMDNVIRPVLIRRGANLPLLLIFTGVIGGLIAFGIVGLFIGPVVLTVTHTLLTAWIAAGDRREPAA